MDERLESELSLEGTNESKGKIVGLGEERQTLWSEVYQ